MNFKRVLAYFIDVMIVSFISVLIFYLPFFKKDFDNYEKYQQTEVDLIMKPNENISEDELNTLEYNLNRASVPLLVINIGMMILYFGVMQYLLKGQTLGKKIMKLKIVSATGDDINPNLFMLRSVLITSFIPNLINILLLLFCNKETWFEFYSIISMIHSTFMFIMVAFIVLRKDGRGLHDLIANTKVISLKKE